MAVLCDWEIKARCNGGMVENFDPDLVNPASLDLRLGNGIMIESIYSPELIRVDISDTTEDNPFMVQPGDFLLAETLEIFNLPNDISAQFVLKSSRARAGFNHMLAGWCDPGWHGSTLTLELKNERQHHADLSGDENRADGIPLNVERPGCELRANRTLQQPPNGYAERGVMCLPAL